MDSASYHIFVMSLCLFFSGVITLLMGIRALVSKKFRNTFTKGSWTGKKAVAQGKKVITLGVIEIVLALILFVTKS